MKLKINKACDLNSISVLPPHSRRPNLIASGADSSVFGRSQASQFRSQQSQQSFSQGMSSQLSQSSLDDVLTNEQRFSSQERENTGKKLSCLAPVSYARDESQMQMSKSSNSVIRRWGSTSASDHRCQVSEELEHRIGLMETSLNRFGIILDSVQKDVMQVNKAVKEVSLETEGVRQKLLVHDNSLQIMLKIEEDIKASLDGSLKSIPEQLRKDMIQYKFQEAASTKLPDQIESRLLKLQHDLCGAFTRQMEAMAYRMKSANHTDSLLSSLPPKRRDYWVEQSEREQPIMDNLHVYPKSYVRRATTQKIKMERRDPVKAEPTSITKKPQITKNKQRDVALVELDTVSRVIIESDEEIDKDFSCLVGGKERGVENCLSDDCYAKGEAARILKKARRRKRKHCNPIIVI